MRPTERWAPSTRERYDRIVRLYIERSPDPALRPVGALKLRDLTGVSAGH